jgi:hypothetical protein
MQQYTVYLYLRTALHVSGGIPTHHQELISLYLQYLALLRPVTAICREHDWMGTGLGTLKPVPFQFYQVHGRTESN